MDSDEDDDSMRRLTPRRHKRHKVDHVLASGSEVVEASESGEEVRRRQTRRKFRVVRGRTADE